LNEYLRLAAEVVGSEPLEASRSFEALYDAESQTLFRRLWLVTGNRAGAEELMQEAFLRVWEPGTASARWTIPSATYTGPP
jgi:DNA-directed RNA polymerase specialized sigma24 family protein